MEIRTYGRTELAQLYIPRITAHSAWQCLRRWIDRCEPLRDKLQQNGYDGRTRTFTPEQVRLIVHYLGEP